MSKATSQSSVLHSVPQTGNGEGLRQVRRDRLVYAVTDGATLDVRLDRFSSRNPQIRGGSRGMDYLSGPTHLSVADARSLLGVESNPRSGDAPRSADAPLPESTGPVSGMAGVLAGLGDTQPRAVQPRATHLIGERAHHIYLIEVPTVDYVAVDGNYVTVHVGEEQYLTRATLSYLERCLEGQHFVRIERSILVNLRRVAYVDRLERGQFVFVLRGGQRLISARERSTELRALFLSPAHFACESASCASTR